MALGDPITWQDGTPILWQSSDPIVWESYHGPSLYPNRTRRRHGLPRRRVTVAAHAPRAQVARFTFSRSITIDHQKCGTADTANFPVLFAGVYPWLRSAGNGGDVQSAGGFDIGFYADPQLTQKLDWEIDTYDPTTGEIAAWVRLPNLSASIDSVYYIGYGDPNLTIDQSSPGHVWDANFLSVYHFGTASALDVSDSTGANPGVNNGATPIASQVEGGANMVAASSQSVDCPANRFNVGATTPTTIEFWLKTSQTAAQLGLLGFLDLATFQGFRVATSIITPANHALWWQMGGATGDISVEGSTNVCDGVRRRVMVTCNGAGNVTALSITVNGVTETLTQTGNTTPVGAVPQRAFDIGGLHAVNVWADAEFDEVRVSNVVRSASYDAASFNNQSNPGTFYTLDLMPSERHVLRRPTPRPYFPRRPRPSVPPRPHNPKSETLIDPLDATAIVAANWLETISGAMTVSRSSVGLAYTFPAATTATEKAILDSRGTYDLTGSYVSVCVVTVPNPGVTSNMLLEAFEGQPSTAGLIMGYSQGNLLALYNNPGQTLLVNITFDPVAHKWWRIREAGGTVFFETAPDGSNWTTRGSAPTPIAVDNLTLSLRALGVGVNVVPGTATFIDFDTNGPYFPWGRQQRRARPALKTRPATRANFTPTQAPVVDRSVSWQRGTQPRRPNGAARRRGRGAETIHGAGRPLEQTARRRARLALPKLRGRRADAPLVQVTPPPSFPFAPVVQPRRLRGLVLRRRARVEPIHGQGAPIPRETRSRRPRFGRNKNRRPSEVVVAQQAPANPDFAWPTVHEARTVRGVSRRRGRGAEVVPPQVTPAAPAQQFASPAPRRLRGLGPRRGRRTEIVASQAAPAAPAFPFAGPPSRRVRGLLGRRGRRAEVVAPQDLVVAEARDSRAVRGIARRRARAEAIPPQQAVVDMSISWSRDRQPRELRGFARTRGRRTDVVQRQLNPPLPILESVQPRRPRGLTRWRGRSFEPVRPQENAALVAVRFAKVSRVKRLGRRQRRPAFDTFGQALGPTSFVKTWDGLARGSIKTFDGVPNASTKTVDGLP